MSTLISSTIPAVEDAKALDLLARARIALIRGRNAPCVFFGTLAMRLVPQIDRTIDTAATDGKRLLINPEFWNSLNDKQRVGVCCHEILHCSNKHMTRRGARDMMLWNVACDLAINPIVIESNLTLPPDCLMPKMFGFDSGHSAEWYYESLQKKAKRDQQGNVESVTGKDDQGREFTIQAGSDPGRCGGVIDAGNDAASKTAAEQEWQRAVGQAASAAKSRGNIPGGLSTVIDRAMRPQVNYWQLLQQFATQTAKDDYDWGRPNRRHLHRGIYLPALWSQKIGKIVVAMDSSGSCWSEAVLTRFAAEVEGIRQVMPSEVVLLYHDTKIQGEPVTVAHDEPFRVEPKGGGGTSHRCVFDWIEQNAEDANVVICLTDLETEFPQRAPECPVIWISILDLTAPFGSVIFLDDQDAAAAM